MEIKSTLQVGKEKIIARCEMLRALGLNKENKARAKEINDLIRKISNFDEIKQHIVETVFKIQPSIGDEDCRIATCFILTNCSDVVRSLLDEGLVKKVNE